MLDTRQYRDDQSCGDRTKIDCGEARPGPDDHGRRAGAVAHGRRDGYRANRDRIAAALVHVRNRVVSPAMALRGPTPP